MADIFGNIFDKLSDNLGDFFSGEDSASTYISAGKDVLGAAAALGAGSTGGGFSNQAETQVYRGLKLSSSLDTGTLNPLSKVKTEESIHSRNAFDKVDSVDPAVLENIWNARLQRYSEVSRMTGVSQTGR